MFYTNFSLILTSIYFNIFSVELIKLQSVILMEKFISLNPDLTQMIENPIDCKIIPTDNLQCRKSGYWSAQLQNKKKLKSFYDSPYKILGIKNNED